MFRFIPERTHIWAHGRDPMSEPPPSRAGAPLSRLAPVPLAGTGHPQRGWDDVWRPLSSLRSVDVTIGRRQSNGRLSQLQPHPLRAVLVLGKVFGPGREFERRGGQIRGCAWHQASADGFHALGESHGHLACAAGQMLKPLAEGAQMDVPLGPGEADFTGLVLCLEAGRVACVHPPVAQILSFSHEAPGPRARGAETR